MIAQDAPTTTTDAQGNQPGPLAVDARGAARLCSLGERTWRRHNAAGLVPRPVRLGGRLLWIVAEVQQWLAAGCPSRVEWERRNAAPGRGAYG